MRGAIGATRLPRVYANSGARRTALFLVGIADLLAPVFAFASEAHGKAHAPSIGELLFPAINFAIYAVIVVRYVIPALREYLRRRSSDVAAAAAEARAALSAAEEARTAAKTRRAAIAAECENVRRDLEIVANRQAERLQAGAEATGKRRVADAAVVADQERRRAFDNVRAEIATLATEIAESRIRSALSDSDQRAFVEGFLKDAPSR